MKIIAVALGAVFVAIGTGLATPLAPKLFPQLEGSLFWVGIALIVAGAAGTLTAFFMKSSEPTPSIVHSVSSSGQTGGITAYNVSISPPQRSLQDPAVIASLQAPIAALERDRVVEICWPVGDSEAGRFAAEIARMIEGQGGEVERHMFAVADVSPGLQVFPEHNRLFVGPHP